jgi:hypothetical protein
MPFGNPVVGGTVLIRPAIRSPNYVAATSGWTINADGSAEFNSLTINGGSVLVRDPDGSYVKIYDQNPGNGAVIDMQPASNVNLGTITPGQLFTDSLYSAPIKSAGLFLTGPTFGGITAPTASLITNDNGGPTEARFDVDADTIRLAARAELDLSSSVLVAISAVNLQYNARRIFAETAYTPVLASITGGVAPTGPGTGGSELSGRYCFISDKRLRVEVLMVGGSAGAGYGSAGNAWGFTLPFTADSDSVKYAVGSVTATDTGLTEYSGICRLASTTQARIILGTSNLGASTPFTFGSTDRVAFSMEYTIP